MVFLNIVDKNIYIYKVHTFFLASVYLYHRKAWNMFLWNAMQEKSYIHWNKFKSIIVRVFL